MTTYNKANTTSLVTNIKCGSFKEQDTCNNQTKCEWHNEDKKCKRKHTVSFEINDTKYKTENITENNKFNELKKSINKKIKQSLGGNNNIFNLNSDCNFPNYNKYCEIYNYFSDEKEDKKRLKQIEYQVTNFSMDSIPEIKSNLEKYESNEEEYNNYLNSTTLKNKPSNNTKIIELINNYNLLKNEGVKLFLNLKSEFELELIKKKIIQNNNIIFI